MARIYFPAIVFAVVLFSMNPAPASAIVSNWQTNPLTCPKSDSTVFSSPCSGAATKKICGNSGSAPLAPLCFDFTVTAPVAPGAATTSATVYIAATGTAGFVVDCYNKDTNGSPFCDNNTNYWCNADNDCTAINHKLTQCNGGYFASSGPSAWTCTSTCVSGYYDCGSGNCDTQSGGGCTTASGVQGTWVIGGTGNDCSAVASGTKTFAKTCVASSSNNFQAGVQMNYNAATNSLLWGTQIGTGPLINFSNNGTGTFSVANNGDVTTAGGLLAGVITGTSFNASGTSSFGAIQVSNASGTYSFPQSDGSSGQFLTTNGSGALYWSTATAGETFWIGNTSTNNIFSFNSGADAALGDDNFFVGVRAGASNTSGTNNNFLGNLSGSANTSGAINNFIGLSAGQLNTSGTGNDFIGAYTGLLNTGGNNNAFFGSEAGYNNNTGSFNTFIGDDAGNRNNGSLNVFLGNNAGYYETVASNLFIVDNQFRGSLGNPADATGSLMYGTFDSNPANQALTINGNLTLPATHTLTLGSNPLPPNAGAINIGTVPQSFDIAIRDITNANILLEGGSSTSLGFIRFKDETDTGTASIGYGNSGSLAPNSLFINRTLPSVPIIFSTALASFARFAATTGHLLINTATDSANWLDVNGDAGIQGQLAVTGTGSFGAFSMPAGASLGYVLTSDASGTGTWQAATAGITGTGTAGYVPEFTSGTAIGNSHIFDNAGNIGIGTTTAAYPLHVVTSAVPTASPVDVAAFEVVPTGARVAGFGPRIIFKDPAGGTLANTMGGVGAVYDSVSSAKAAALAFYINPNTANTLTEAMRITSFGKVGIGMTPLFKLDVAGDINVASGSAYLYNGYAAIYAKPELGDYFFGSEALPAPGALTGSENTSVGEYSLIAMGSGSYNTTNGAYSMFNNTSGTSNTANGFEALFSNVSGNNNTAIGADAGYWNASGSGNVFLGANAGSGETGSNKLYISNTTSQWPLVYGDFSTSALTINGTLGIGSGSAITYYTFPRSFGTNGYVLTTNGAGTATWSLVNLSSAVTGTLGVANGGTGLATGTQGGLLYFSGATSTASTASGTSGQILTSGGAGAPAWATNLWYQPTAPNNNLFSNLPLAGTSTVSGANNFFVGSQAGANDNSGAFNIFTGYQAGYSNVSGNNNVFSGNQAGYANTIGAQNVYIGYQAGMTSGTSENVFIGDSAGINSTAGAYNTFMGQMAGASNTASYGNFLGAYAGYHNQGNGNNFFGYQSGQANTSGYHNNFLGYNSGLVNTSGAGNNFLGLYTGQSNIGGNYNNFLGYTAGQYNTSGSNNNFIGFQAGQNNTTGNNTIAIGLNAGQNFGRTAADYNNVFLGQGAGVGVLGSSTGVDNFFVGLNAGTADTSGSGNIFLGNSAGVSNSTGNNNNFIGYQAGSSNATSTNNFIGYRAGYHNTIGGSIFIGNQAGFANTAGLNNIFIGDLAGASNTIGAFNNFIGEGAGQSNATGSNTVAVGYQTGYSFSVPTIPGSDYVNFYNTFIGNQAGYGSSGPGTAVGTNHLFGGYQAGYSITTGSNDVFLGATSGHENTSGGFNTFVGTASGYHNISADNNVFNGYQSGYENTTGVENTYLGFQSGLSDTGSSANRNVFLGAYAGYWQTGSDTLVIDDRNRGSAPNEATGSLMYGKFDDNPINQTLTVNAKLQIGNGMGVQYAFPQTYGNGLPLISQGQAQQAIWSQLNLASAVTATLGVSNGGTGGSATPIAGGIAYGTGSSYAFIPATASGEFLTSNGTGAPYWTNGSSFITLSSLYAGTGISYNPGTGQISNTAPDQTVTLTSGAGISVTGTYPNFTITNTSGGASSSWLYRDSSANIFIGQTTLSLSGGTQNVYVGDNAGANTSSGISNTGIGYHAGRDNTIGTGNIYIGYEAGNSDTPPGGNSDAYLYINSNPGVPLIFGNFTTHQVGIAREPAVGSGNAFEVQGDAGKTAGGTSWNNLSDAKYKTILNNVDNGLEIISKLQPIHYEWNDLHEEKFGKSNDTTMYGFVAQNVKEVLPEMVKEDQSGDLWYNPSGFEAVLTSAIQEQQKQIGALNLEISGASGTAGVATVGEINAGKVVTKTAKMDGLELVDRVTGETYCTWIANGEMQKAKGICNQVAPAVPGQSTNNSATGTDGTTVGTAVGTTNVNISSVTSIPDVTIEYGAPLSSANLPATVTATMDDNSTQSVTVTWDGGTPAFDQNTAGTYNFLGMITLPDGVTNTNNLKAFVNVIVQPQQQPLGLIYRILQLLKKATGSVLNR